MTIYTPDRWVKLKITSPSGEVIDKIFAAWMGGFAQSDYWKINSGNVAERDLGDRLEVDGYSGSTYVLYKTGYGMNLFMHSIISGFQKDAEKNGAKIEVIGELA